jgi:hypothetical protein
MQETMRVAAARPLALLVANVSCEQLLSMFSSNAQKPDEPVSAVCTIVWGIHC